MKASGSRVIINNLSLNNRTEVINNQTRAINNAHQNVVDVAIVPQMQRYLFFEVNLLINTPTRITV